MTRADVGQVCPTVVIAASVTSLDMTAVANRARALGCDAVELVTAPTLSSADWAAIRAGLAENNLRCAGLALGEGGVNPGASDVGTRSKARERITTAIHDASRIGASYIRIVPARLDVANARYENAYHHVLDALLALRHDAGLNGIRIVMHLGECGFLTSPIEARHFLDAVNSPWVGGTVNLAACGSSSIATDWIESLTHRLRVVGVEGSTATGLDWGVIGTALAAERFDGFIVTPSDGVRDIDNRLSEIRAAYPAPLPPV